MGIGASLVLIALGAILHFAVTQRVSGVNIATVGTILMIVGVVGLLLSLLFMTMRRRTDVIATPGRRTIIEPGVPPDAL